MTYLVATDSALSRVLGVSRAAIGHAEMDGNIRRCADGSWDVLDVVRCWRHNTLPSLQRPARGRAFRPWLDPSIPLRSSILAELRRRALAEGAEAADDGWAAGDGDDEDLVLEDDDGDGADDDLDVDE